MEIGLRKNPSVSSSEQIVYLKFSDAFAMSKIFGSYSLINGGYRTNYDFNKPRGGMIGVYGTSTEMLNSLGPYSDPGSCECSETTLVAPTISDMAASVTTGVTTVQSVPVFPDTFSSGGWGSCGG